MIKNNKIYNFATESGKWKIQGTEGKITEATLIRELLGSILCLSMQQKIDMTEVLKYPFTPVLLCLSHAGNSLNNSLWP